MNLKKLLQEAPRRFKHDGSRFYDCPECKGRGKLEVSHTGTSWFCHKCSRGGRLHTGKASVLSPWQSQDVFGGGYSVCSPGSSQWGYLQKRGLTNDRIRELSPHRGPIPTRVYFPVYDLGGTSPVQFVGRSMFMETGGTKYKSGSGKEFSVKITDCLWGLHRIRLPQTSVILMEGILDAVTHPEGLALFGTQLSPGQLNWLKKISPKEIVIALDGDAIDATMSLAKKLVRASLWRVSIIRLPYGLDPDQVDLVKYLQKRETIG